MLQVIGNINLPPGVNRWGPLAQGGLVGFLSVIFKALIIIGGIWTLLNIILAGYQFLAAGGKPDDIKNAWAKIWQSLIGLLFMAGAFVLAAIFGWMIFGDPTLILQPRLFGP